MLPSEPEGFGGKPVGGRSRKSPASIERDFCSQWEELFPLFLRLVLYCRLSKEPLPMTAVYAQGAGNRVQGFGLRALAAVFEMADVSLRRAAFIGKLILAHLPVFPNPAEFLAESIHDNSNRSVLTRRNCVVLSPYDVSGAVQS